MIETTSPDSGNLPKAFFEKIRSSLTLISKTPPPLDISLILLSGKAFLISASKLEACGK